MRYPITGVVLPNSNVTAYNNDGVTPATIYAAQTGGAALPGGVVTANDKGAVVFWVDDGDYPFVSYFDISVGGVVRTQAWAAFATVVLDGAG